MTQNWPLVSHFPRARWVAANRENVLVAADVADNVGDVLVTFFFVSNDGRNFIITIIIFDGLVDLDIVLGLGNDSSVASPQALDLDQTFRVRATLFEPRTFAFKDKKVQRRL
jgi:hypothetical protein